MSDPARLLAAAAIAVGTVALVVLVVGWALARRRRPAGDRPMPAHMVDGRRALVERLEGNQAAGDQRAVGALLLLYLHGGSVVPGAVAHDRSASIDGLLRQLASEFGPGAVFRLATHELAVLSTHRSAGRLREQAERILALAAAHPRAGLPSVGVALAASGSPPPGLWGDADAALRTAVQRGARSVVFASDLGGATPVVTTDELDQLRQLLADERVSITYQPIFALDSRQLLGFEALSRPSSRYGFEGPAQAFAAAARLGREGELDAVCRAAVFDDGPGFDMPSKSLLFVNVSPAGLDHQSLRPGVLVRAVERAGLTPARVVFELTEPSTLDPGIVAARAGELAELGFKIALDDLGAGPAGFDWLWRIPADYLKIDPTVLARAGSDPLAAALVHAVCVVADHTGATVVAEGIADDELLALARQLPGPPTGRLRLHAGQGYHLARPAARPLDPRAVSAG